MSTPADPHPQADGIPLFAETVGGSLIDAARIAVMGASCLLPPPLQTLIVTRDTPGPSEEDPAASVHGCLEQAMNWLDRARELTIEQGAPVTSLHTVGGRG